MKSKVEYMTRRIQDHLQNGEIAYKTKSIVVRKCFKYKKKQASIQASGDHYCSPRKSYAKKYYTAEVSTEWFSKTMEPYSDSSVYCCVPISTIAKALIYD